jgi:hypothetical protein
VCDFDDPLSQYERLVGRFMLAFGEIELLTFILLHHYELDRKPPHNFKERAGIILDLLRRDATNLSKLVEPLEESLRLADKRNAVAHHPICAQIFQHTGTDKYLIVMAVQSQTNDEYITDQELARLGDHTRNLANRMYSLLPTNDDAPAT